MHFVPSLKHEDAPELVLQFTVSLLMCAPRTSYWCGLEEAFRGETPFIE